MKYYNYKLIRIKINSKKIDNMKQKHILLLNWKDIKENYLNLRTLIWMSSKE